ncbi:hypothetical protein BJ912DRAFT_849474 [Pholiota molesta]|nr:hypothetical protein BJ912DRAFT_849474 [Pholiota molesta]
MSTYGDVFEPETIKNILGGLEESKEAKVKFQNGWKENVKKRLEKWQKTDNKETPLFQLQWEAEVLAYVDYLYSKLIVNGNASARSKDTPRIIGKNIPLLGPRFSPPTLFHYMRRDATPTIKPEIVYISPINVVHPVYYPTLAVCPQCDSQAILWDGWNANGARRVYGVRSNERAIGWQLRCKDCRPKNLPEGYCFTTTNPVFWDRWPHWKIPSKPFFVFSVRKIYS